jgi:hypothetical protein
MFACFAKKVESVAAELWYHHHLIFSFLSAGAVILSGKMLMMTVFHPVSRIEIVRARFLVFGLFPLDERTRVLVTFTYTMTGKIIKRYCYPLRCCTCTFKTCKDILV